MNRYLFKKIKCLTALILVQLLVWQSVSYALSPGSHVVDMYAEFQHKVQHGVPWALMNQSAKEHAHAPAKPEQKPVPKHEHKHDHKHEYKKVETLKLFYSIPSECFALGLVILVLAVVFTGGSYWFLMLGLPLLIQVIYDMEVTLELYWNKSALKKVYDFMQNSAGVVIIAIVLFGLMEILGHLVMVGAAATPLFWTFTVISLIGVIVYALPEMNNGWKAVFKAIDFGRQGKNPMRALGMSFVRGFSLFLFILLPLLGIVHLNLALVVLIAASVQFAYILKRQAREYQMEAMGQLKNREIPRNIVVVALNGAKLQQKVILTEEEVQDMLNQGIEVTAYVAQNTWVPRMDGLIEAVINQKQAYVDESELNGEEQLKLVKTSDQIKGGTFLTGAPIHVRILQVGEQSEIGHIECSLKRFSSKGVSRIERFSDKVGQYFIYTVFFFAIVGFLVSYLTVGSITTALIGALTVFVIICPCAFLIGQPLAFSAARQNLAATHKISVNDDRSFLVPRVMVFDKSNTITDGVEIDREKPWVSLGADMDDEKEKERILKWAAMAEYPYAQNQYAQEVIELAIHHGATDRLKLENHKNSVKSQIYESGKGLKAIIKEPHYGHAHDQEVYLGNLETLLTMVTTIPEEQQQALRRQVDEVVNADSDQVVTPIVMYDITHEKPLLVFRIINRIRPKVKEFLEDYRNIAKRNPYYTFLNGVSRLLFRTDSFPSQTLAVVASGDRKEAVRKIVKKIDIKLALAEVSPSEKALFVLLLKHGGWLGKFQKDLEKRKDPLILTYQEFRTYLMDKRYATKKEVNDLEQIYLKEHQGPEDHALKTNVVFFMGDGSNDRQAMQVAHAGISFNGARSVGQGDILLGADKKEQPLFSQVSYIIKTFRRTYGIILTNIFLIAFVWNIVILTLIFAGVLGPGWAALMHALNTLFVVILAMKLMAKPKEFFKQEFKNMFKGKVSHVDKEPKHKSQKKAVQNPKSNVAQLMTKEGVRPQALFQDDCCRSRFRGRAQGGRGGHHHDDAEVDHCCSSPVVYRPQYYRVPGLYESRPVLTVAQLLGGQVTAWQQWAGAIADMRQLLTTMQQRRNSKQANITYMMGPLFDDYVLDEGVFMDWVMTHANKIQLIPSATVGAMHWKDAQGIYRIHIDPRLLKDSGMQGVLASELLHELLEIYFVTHARAQEPIWHEAYTIENLDKASFEASIFALQIQLLQAWGMDMNRIRNGYISVEQQFFDGRAFFSTGFDEINSSVASSRPLQEVVQSQFQVLFVA